MKIKIADKTISPDSNCFIIAEAGVNHNGDIKKAKLLIDIAKKADADAVKFQTFKAENLLLPQTPLANYQKQNTAYKNQFQMIKELELTYSQFEELKDYCDKNDIIFLSTPADEGSASFLNKLVPAFKIASPDLTNHLLLKHIAKFKKPMIVSTGMSTLKECKDAKEIIQKQGNNEMIFLHCITNYPCPEEETNLNAIKTMQKELNTLVGFSDHTTSTQIPLIAVYLGARVIEKHFTYDKSAQGPDHKASLNPEELKEMVKKIREFEQLDKEQQKQQIEKIPNLKAALGNGTKQPQESELKNAPAVKKYIVAKAAISTGTKITEAMLTAKRTGGIGIPANDYLKIIGKTAKRNIASNEIISLNLLE